MLGFRNSGKFYYGWLIVAATWFTYIALTSVTTYSGSVVTTHLVLDRGWDERVVGIINSCMYASLAIFSVPAGMGARKWGCRVTYILAAVTGGFVCFVLYVTNAPLPVYMAAFFLFGISTALGGQVTAPIMIECWFDRRKSLPMAIVMAAGGIGGFLLPPVTEYLYKVLGVRGCWVFMGVFEFAALLPILIIYRDHPEDIGEVKDGKDWVKGHPAAESRVPEREDRTRKAVSLIMAYKSREFLLICVMNTVFRISQTTFIAYALIHMIRFGLSASVAVIIIAVSNIFSLIGRFLVALTEKLNVQLKTWAVVSFLLLAAGEILFAVSASYFLLLSAGLLIGFSTGFLTTLVPILLSEQCGEIYFNEQYGMLNTVSFSCMIVSPVLVSVLAGVYNGYSIAFFILAVIGIVCAGLAGILRREAQ